MDELSTVPEMKQYIREHGLKKEGMRLTMKKPEMIEAFKRLGHWKGTALTANALVKAPRVAMAIRKTDLLQQEGYIPLLIDGVKYFRSREDNELFTEEFDIVGTYQNGGAVWGSSKYKTDHIKRAEAVGIVLTHKIPVSKRLQISQRREAFKPPSISKAVREKDRYTGRSKEVKKAPDFYDSLSRLAPGFHTLAPHLTVEIPDPLDNYIRIISYYGLDNTIDDFYLTLEGDDIAVYDEDDDRVGRLRVDDLQIVFESKSAMNLFRRNFIQETSLKTFVQTPEQFKGLKFQYE